MLPISGFDLPMRAVTCSAAATSSGFVDTLGYNFCSIDISIFPGHTTATNNPTVFKLGQSNDTYLSNATDITAFVGDGVGGWTIPNIPTVTTTPYTVKMNVDCRSLARYLHLEMSALGTTLTATAYANLYRAEQLPNTAAETGQTGAAQGTVAAVVNG